jgi:hypothetical protein
MTVDPVPQHPNCLRTLAWKKDGERRSTAAGLYGIATINGAGQRSFLGFENRAAHVMATRSTDVVGRNGLAAVRTERQLTGRQKVVRPPGAGLLV